MRELLILRLKGLIAESGEYGIPPYFDCTEDEYITDPDTLNGLSDEELLDVYETTVGFGG